MATARTVLDAEAGDLVERVAAAATSSDTAALRKVRAEVARRAKRANGTYERGLYDGLLAVIDSARGALGGGVGLAPQSAPLEPGSLAARMLIEIAEGVQGANADLAERLDTDQWQVSRAGRRLRDLGLATRSRAGRLNAWVLTSAGRRAADRLRSR